MRVLLPIALCFLLAGVATAQRHGGGGSRGSGGSVGRAGGMGASGARIGSPVAGGSGSGARIGVGAGVAIGGAGRRIGGLGRPLVYGRPYGYGYPLGVGVGLGYWPYYYDSGYYPDTGYYPYAGDDSSAYQSNATPVYPTQAQEAPPEEPQARAQYDEYGQEIEPAPAGDGAPIYLIALKGSVVYAATWYEVAGDTVRYLTLDRQQKQTPLAGLDRELTLRLNRQRGVPFDLP